MIMSEPFFKRQSHRHLVTLSVIEKIMNEKTDENHDKIITLGSWMENERQELINGIEYEKDPK